jgi:arabinofuranosyltransferase
VRSIEDDAFDPPPRAHFNRGDWVFLLILFFAGLFPVVSAWHAAEAPKEDALMLLRYSEHLAQGHGITWNVGEKPVEGATDFLYMVLVGGISKATGLGVIQAARIVIGASWIALPLLVFLATRLTLGGDFWFCAAVALYMSAGPGAKYVQTCFGAPMAALAAGITWWLANELMYRKVTWSKAVGMGLSAVILGLIRPEGSLLGLFILLAVLIKRPRRLGVIFVGFMICFATIGLTYFLWRCYYFGYLLPNPFYVKGGGHFHADGLKRSMGNMCRMLWPVIPIGVFALRGPQTRNKLLVLLVPVIAFTGIWLLLSNENNHLMRFQLPLVPIVLISLPSLLWGVATQLQLPKLGDLPRGVRLAAIASAVCYLAICMVGFKLIYGPSADVASGVVYPTAMRKFADKGYTMAVTEAGQFPFYSKWKAIDTLGLNDSHIAHFGISETYLDQYQPELMMYHVAGWGSYKDFDAELHEADQPVGPLKEDRAARVMHQYALHHGYILAAAYGDAPCNMHFFWVKPGTIDTDALVAYIRNTPYYFLDSGLLSADYRDNLPHSPCTMS